MTNTIYATFTSFYKNEIVLHPKDVFHFVTKLFLPRYYHQNLVRKLDSKNCDDIVLHSDIIAGVILIDFFALLVYPTQFLHVRLMHFMARWKWTWLITTRHFIILLFSFLCRKCRNVATHGDGRISRKQTRCGMARLFRYPSDLGCRWQ